MGILTSKLNPANNTPDINALKMKQNFFRFFISQRLWHAQRAETKSNQGRKVVSWPEFRVEVLKLNRTYNLNYLQAECQMAQQAGHHTANWQKFQKIKIGIPT